VIDQHFHPKSLLRKGSLLYLIVASTSYADQACLAKLFARVRPFSVRSPDAKNSKKIMHNRIFDDKIVAQFLSEC
jgi:hypothetical protein